MSALILTALVVGLLAFIAGVKVGYTYATDIHFDAARACGCDPIKYEKEVTRRLREKVGLSANESL